jgi:hypothetical protein
MSRTRSAAARNPSGVLGDALLLKRLAAELGFTPLPAGREALSALVPRLPARFPPLYELLVISYRWPETLLGPVSLLANPPGPDLTGLADEIFRDPALTEALHTAGHLQLGRVNGGGSDPICFDTTRQRADRDAPIVRINCAEILRNGGIRIVEEIAPSFRQLVNEFLG